MRSKFPVLVQVLLLVCASRAVSVLASPPENGPCLPSDPEPCPAESSMIEFSYAPSAQLNREVESDFSHYDDVLWGVQSLIMLRAIEAKRIWETPTADLVAALRIHLPSSTWGLDGNELQSGAIYSKFIHAPDSDAGLAILRNEGRQLSSPLKIRLLQATGMQFLLGYDHGRIADGPTSDGIVTLDQLLATARAQLAGDTQAFAGVCRDMTSAQGEMALALGFENVYVLSYMIAGEGSHAALYFEDPENAGESRLINYFSLAENRGAWGSSAAFQPWKNLPDGALQYRVAFPAGKTVHTLPTRLMQFLTLGLQGREGLADLSPGTTLEGGRASFGASVNRFTEAQVFLFSDPATGTSGRVFGLRFHADSPILSTSFVISRNEIERDDLLMNHYFASLRARLSTPDLLSGGNASARLFVQEHAAILQGRGRVVKVNNEKKREDHTALFAQHSAGAISAFRSDSGDFRAEVESRFDFSKGTSDIRGGDWSYFLNRNVTRAELFWKLSSSAEGRSRLLSDPEGRAWLFTALTAIFDHWGGGMVAEGGFVTPEMQALLRFQKRFKEEDPLFLDQAVPLISLEVNRNFSKHRAQLGTTLTYRLQNGGEVHSVGVQGKIPVGKSRRKH